MPRAFLPHRNPLTGTGGTVSRLSQAVVPPNLCLFFVGQRLDVRLPYGGHLFFRPLLFAAVQWPLSILYKLVVRRVIMVIDLCELCLQRLLIGAVTRAELRKRRALVPQMHIH